MRNRLALIHHIEKMIKESPREFDGINPNSVELYLDVTNHGDAHEIIEVIGNPLFKNKFKLIIRLILKGKYDKSLYRKESDIVTAMKFMGFQQNSRIYCLEIPATRNEKKKIVMAKCFFSKTSESNNKTNNPIIKSIEKYEYEYKK